MKNGTDGTEDDAMTRRALRDGLLQNRHIADQLVAYADLLAQQGGDGFRERAYRAAAGTVQRMDRPLVEVLAEQGLDGLIDLPTIGAGIASAIAEMLRTGHWARLDLMSGAAAPDRLFRTLPGIGPILAASLAEATDAETLEALEMALLQPGTKVPGLGPRRRAMILAGLSDRLARINAGAPRATAGEQPDVGLLLRMDNAYRAAAEAGKLRMIAPRRFNPEGLSWLPIQHRTDGGWEMTALYSNTALAHRLDRTRDWVVIDYHNDKGAQGRCTVLTEPHGPLEGKRVVRGREAECAAYYGAGR
jgi:hypothetical protein